MDYMRQLNAFWDWRKTNAITHVQADLYFTLLACANTARWRSPLSIPNSTLIGMCQVCRSDLQKHRGGLIQKGLIEYAKGKKGVSGKYIIVPLYRTNSNTNTRTDMDTNMRHISKHNTKTNTENQSINPVEQAEEAVSDRIDTMDIYREIICENISYDILCERHSSYRVNEVVELMLEAVCSRRPHIRISGDERPAAVVKSRLLKVDSSHVEYVFECLDKNTTKIHNIKSYLLTALYNAPATMDSYYRAEVNHDFYGGAVG